MTRGIVYLVGAGPGDPSLITVRGVQCLKEADVVIHDNLANSVLLDHAPAEAERIYVGKQAGQHTLKQPDINSLLVTKAKENLAVVRLKGGDPFVFGRGGEEALALREAGIQFEIVPGVTAGIAAPAYAGIPVTHRSVASSVTFITGHEDPTKEDSAINWKSLALQTGTLVFYMGIGQLPAIVSQLVDNGCDPQTPVAIVRYGTLPAQYVLSGTLEDIVSRARATAIAPPALIVVGEVVALRKDLAWFEQRPLFGKRILVTRTRTQASALSRRLQTLGAEAICMPTIRIVPPDDPAPLQDAASAVDTFDWIVFTSTNAVSTFFDALHKQNWDTRRLAECRVCAVGPATAQALAAVGVTPDLIPAQFTGQAAAQELIDKFEVTGKMFLLPRADIANPLLPELLEQAGAIVQNVTAYCTVQAEIDPEILGKLQAGEIDIVTFTSSSTAQNFVSLLREQLDVWPPETVFASIGPETTKAAVAAGISITIEAENHTIDGLLSSMVEYVQRNLS